MTHFRQRSASHLIKKALTYSPVVGLLGMRQVGKSTLVKEYTDSYHTFDDESFLVKFQSDGKSILDSNQTIGLDEIQKYPPTFDLIKTLVDQKRKPGRFLITGSIRFSSKKNIRESLTGRIITFELFPLTLSECHSQPLSKFLATLFSTSKITQSILDKFESTSWADEGKISYYFQTGGLPGICFRRDISIRHELMRAHLETLLARDIHFIKRTTLPFSKLLNLVEEIAKREGTPMNALEVSKIIGTSHTSIRSLLDALEGLFLIRPYGSTYFIEDAGLSFYLKNTLRNDITRMDMIKMVYLELRAQIQYCLRTEVSMAPYQTRGGIDIPFFLKHRSGKQLAICVDTTDYPTEKSIKSLIWAKKKFPDLRPIIFYRNKKPLITPSGVICLPLRYIY